MIRRLSVLLLAASSLTQAAEEIRFAASDLLADFLEPSVVAFGTTHEIEIDYDSIGSLPALDRLRSDEIDAAIIAAPGSTADLREEFVVFPFAYAISVIVVNETNPTNELSLSELGGIFGANEELKINTWGELGLAGWSNRTIKPVASQLEQGIALELFKHKVFKGKAMKSSVAMAKPLEVENMVSADSASIGIVTRAPKQKGLKAVMVSTAADAPAYGPSRDNVHFGDYPVRLPFYVVFDRRDENRMKELMRMLLSDQIADELEQNDIVSLPLNVRRKLLIDLDLEK